LTVIPYTQASILLKTAATQKLGGLKSHLEVPLLTECMVAVGLLCSKLWALRWMLKVMWDEC